MAITKIGTPELFDFSSLNTALQLPTGTTAERPGTLAGTLAPVAGEWRYNTTLSYVEYYDGTSPYDAAKWFQIDDEALPATCTTDTINYPTGTTNTAYYKMSDATDSTLNGYNGTPTSVNFNVAGKFGNAGEFNGSSSKIQIANNSFNYSTMSFSGWVNPSANDAYMYIFQNGMYDNRISGSIGWYVRRDAGGSLLARGYSANSLTVAEFDITSASGTIPLNTWTNVVCVLTPTSFNIYVNGNSTAVASASFTNPVTYSSTQPAVVHVGSGYYYNNAAIYESFWEGKLDQVRIFNKALDEGEVLQLYNEPNN